MMLSTSGRLRVKLFPVPQSSGLARMFVRHHLLALGYPDLVDDGCLITAELVTNALRATRAEIWVTLSRNDGDLLLEVWDSSPSKPVRQTPGLYATSGRGLTIVEAVAAEHGCRLIDNGNSGKVVWARLK